MNKAEPTIRKQAQRLLVQLDDNRPRRALDIDAARHLLEALAAPADVDKLIANLIREAWSWGVSCEVDGVCWGEAGDSYNQMKRDHTQKAATRLRAALAAQRTVPLAYVKPEQLETLKRNGVAMLDASDKAVGFCTVPIYA